MGPCDPNSDPFAVRSVEQRLQKLAASQETSYKVELNLLEHLYRLEARVLDLERKLREVAK